jgi:hypothetical protein
METSGLGAIGSQEARSFWMVHCAARAKFCRQHAAILVWPGLHSLGYVAAVPIPFLL